MPSKSSLGVKSAPFFKMPRMPSGLLVICLGIDGQFSDDVMATLRDAGAGKIVTSNTVFHETNGFSVAPEFFEGVAPWMGNAPWT